ncbi:asparagine synthase (glutamine-hydrolyzing) [Psychroflexus aestuariivivens]|uniref:asparagine synthase (glutamine-hydrolyzing) n=1 Tax=Psychroflexus aestuariivivens TaxID=1795040 RepID=UPI000FDBA416|nr:asparagine synthase (glutamine-hydrolyzing) [Psychroflexus aestuariivivens]
MCGLVGFVDIKQKSTEAHLRAMVGTLKHRGPDSQDHLLLKRSNYYIGLGHARLSIIDLTSVANQPMQFEHLQIVFNGEIYNYKEIKDELKELGHHFNTSSDTEVILQAYKVWGKQAIHKFIGMFAFAIYDQQNNELFLCRDRAGVKPLFVYQHEHLLLFASELKAFHEHPLFKKDLNINAVHAYFDFGYVPSPHCIFKNCYKVNAGEYITYNLNNLELKKKKYWSIDTYYNKEKSKISYEEAKHEVHELLKSSYAYRMVSDVPVGVFLSGGYDSTSVAAILQNKSEKPIKTFTIGFKEGNNEAPFAKETAKYLGTDHYEYYCTEKEAQELIPDLAYYYDEPFADSSAIPTTLVSKFAKQEVTVSLSADGGDEIFAGYSQYWRFPEKMRKLSKWSLFQNKWTSGLLKGISSVMPNNQERPKHILESLSNNFKGKGEKLAVELYESARKMPNFHTRKLFNTQANPKLGFEIANTNLESIEQLMIVDYQSYLHNDILTKVDRATMTHSLEGREPMLDHRLAEYVARLPIDFKYNNGISKRILKDIVHDYVPKSMMERPKTGFSIPVLKWLREDLSFYVDEYLSKEKLDQVEIINTEYALLLINKFKLNKLHYTPIIWKLLMFMMWWEKWEA